MRLSILAVTFVAFTAYSLIVVAGQGYFGFLSLAWADPWGMQLFIDLCIALFLFTCWMIPDARSRGIPSWPYLLGILSLGSIGALAYLVHRELRKPADSGTDLTNFLSPAARTPELQPRAEKGALAYLVHRELRKPADSGTDLTNFLSPAARTPELQPRAEKGSL